MIQFYIGTILLAFLVVSLLLVAGMLLRVARALEGRGVQAPAARGDAVAPAPKVLDTSVIIDGRIVEVAAAGFLEGRLVLPRFVIHELQTIADSQESPKRGRGRRGLDALRRLRETPGLDVEITDRDYADLREADTKLVRLAREIGGSLLTNDFNLNKIASIEGVRVLNLNDLANAVKTITLPGESIEVPITREGKEAAQGVGYLEDGTMVVVEGARGDVGRRVEAVVTNVHQTSAGRMIFARVARDGASAPSIRR